MHLCWVGYLDFARKKPGHNGRRKGCFGLSGTEYSLFFKGCFAARNGRSYIWQDKYLKRKMSSRYVRQRFRYVCGLFKKNG